MDTHADFEQRIAMLETIIVGLLSEVMELKTMMQATEHVLKNGQTSLDEWENLKNNGVLKLKIEGDQLTTVQKAIKPLSNGDSLTITSPLTMDAGSFNPLAAPDEKPAKNSLMDQLRKIASGK